MRALTEQGHNVVHVDDDPKAALCVARVDEMYPYENRVLVFLMRNLGSHPWLIKRSYGELPANVVPVRSFHDASFIFAKHLAQNAI